MQPLLGSTSGLRLPLKLSSSSLAPERTPPGEQKAPYITHLSFRVNPSFQKNLPRAATNISHPLHRVRQTPRQQHNTTRSGIQFAAPRGSLVLPGPPQAISKQSVSQSSPDRSMQTISPFWLGAPVLTVREPLLRHGTSRPVSAAFPPTSPSSDHAASVLCAL